MDFCYIFYRTFISNAFVSSKYNVKVCIKRYLFAFKISIIMIIYPKLKGSAFKVMFLININYLMLSKIYNIDCKDKFNIIKVSIYILVYIEFLILAMIVRKLKYGDITYELNNIDTLLSGAFYAVLPIFFLYKLFPKWIDDYEDYDETKYSENPF